MDLLLGIDVGTTATKTLLINQRGETLALAQQEYKIIPSHNAWIEQDPGDWWNAIVKTVKRVVKNDEVKKRIKGISLSTQGGTLIPVGSQGKPLRKAITWLDQRAAKQGEKLREKFGDHYFYKQTGYKPRSGLPLLYICWLKDNEPELFKKANKFLFVNDYIIYRLTGRYCTDPSNASITMLYNLKLGNWDEQLLQTAGISRERLSEVKDSGIPIGKLTRLAAKILNLSQEVIVSSGGHDQYCASLGSGAFRDGSCLVSCGTAWVLLCSSGKAVFDAESNITPGRHVIKDKWGAMFAISSGGVVMEWFKDNLISRCIDDNKDNTYDLYDKKAKDILAGSNNLLFFPHFIGSTAPTYQPSAKGAIVGLTLSHTKYEIFRSIMESLGFETLWNIEVIEKLGISIKKIKMIGGAVKSNLWPQIIADIIGKRIFIPSMTEAACLGAAILAGVGAGVFKTPEEGFGNLQIKEKEIVPLQDNMVKYRDLFKIYKETFWKLQDSYKSLDSV